MKRILTILKLYVFLVAVVALTVASCKSKKRAVYQPKRATVRITITKPVKSKPTPRITARKEISTESYIETFKDIAMHEMRKYNIPASITLAQGILESRSGNSKLTLKSNNHFGIKCHKGWSGKRTYHDDDEEGECFRVYKDPNISYKDHSLFLTTRGRYANLFKLEKGDYVNWAIGLSEAGYATDRRYPAKLIALIEKYNLSQYDTIVLGNPFNSKIVSRPSTHIVIKGDTLYSISRKYGLTVDELKRINSLESNEIGIGQTLLLVK